MARPRVVLGAIGLGSVNGVQAAGAWGFRGRMVAAHTCRLRMVRLREHLPSAGWLLDSGQSVRTERDPRRNAPPASRQLDWRARALGSGVRAVDLSRQYR